MSLDLLTSIRSQLEPGIVVEFHRSGEPTAHPQLAACLDLFAGFTTCLVSHGETLADKAEQIIGRCTTVCVSAFRGDPDAEVQYESVRTFLERKGTSLPRLLIKWVGDGDASRYERLGVPVIRRLIHNPTGNTHYAHQFPTQPEVGVCLDLLHRPSITWDGIVSLCNRMDPQEHLKIGNLKFQTLAQIWHGQTRRGMIAAHQRGDRAAANATCGSCTYWGVPSQWQPSPKALPMVQV